jgi:hypothetical protein
MSTAVKTAVLSDTLYRRLKKENPALSEKELRRIDAQLSLQKIEGTVKENSLTMSMITEEVNDVRAKRYARKKSRL